MSLALGWAASELKTVKTLPLSHTQTYDQQPDNNGEVDAAPVKEEQNAQRSRPAKLPEQGGGNPFLAELSRRFRPAEADE